MSKGTRHAKAAIFLFYCVLAFSGSVRYSNGQELEPRTYSAAPVGTNVLVIAYGRSAGNLTFDPSLPVTDGKATINTGVAGYLRSINFFGRSASISVAVPYVWGDISGNLSGQFQQAHRSGVRDPAIRFAVNLKGAPAMDLKQFA